MTTVWIGGSRARTGCYATIRGRPPPSPPRTAVGRRTGGKFDPLLPQLASATGGRPHEATPAFMFVAVLVARSAGGASSAGPRQPRQIGVGSARPPAPPSRRAVWNSVYRLRFSTRVMMMTACARPLPSAARGVPGPPTRGEPARPVPYRRRRGRRRRCGPARRVQIRRCPREPSPPPPLAHPAASDVGVRTLAQRGRRCCRRPLHAAGIRAARTRRTRGGGGGVPARGPPPNLGECVPVETYVRGRSRCACTRERWKKGSGGAGGARGESAALVKPAAKALRDPRSARHGNSGEAGPHGGGRRSYTAGDRTASASRPPTRVSAIEP